MLRLALEAPVWPINALLVFPDCEAADAFFSDPAYLKLVQQHRKPAYASLNLKIFTLNHWPLIEDSAIIGLAAVETPNGVVLGRGVERKYLTGVMPFLQLSAFDGEEKARKFLKSYPHPHQLSFFKTRPARMK